MSATNITIEKPDAVALNSRAQRMLDAARSIVIDSPVMYETAAEELAAVKANLSDLDARRKAITKPLDDAKAAVMALFKPPVEFLSEAERIIKGSMLTYQQAEEARRREEQARVEAAARAERERLAAEAEALRAAGRVEEAEVKADVASLMVAPSVDVGAPKVAGVSVRKTWKAEVTDKAALVAYIAAHPEFLDVLDVSSTVLGGLARSLKDKLPLAGVRVYEDASLSSRKG